jgi:hypothetical protein
MYGDDLAHDVDLPPVTYHAAQFHRMWEDYLRSMESGQPARVSDVDGRGAVEVILAAHRSNQLGRAVRLPLE